MSDSVLVGKGKNELRLLGPLTNRHGLVAGATGTGKTVTLRVMAEGLSRIGVPVFITDVKGDLAGMSQPGDNEKLQARATELGVADFAWQASPVVFWDVFGEQGHPLRTTISDLGPLLLSRLLTLNDTQTGVLNVVFKVADDEGLLLLDLKDLQAMVRHVGENAKAYSASHGNVSAASVAAIQRRLLELSEQNAERFFGEPALEITDLIRTDTAGRGVVSILAAAKLMQSPKTYATFLLWLLAELYEKLPEVGDLERPKLVLFFDEAHLLFDEAPKVVLAKIEQVVRLIRSKGVGVYFVTQSPLDIPDDVLGQLGNRVQHALRAFTPKDQKTIRAAAQTFRTDGSFSIEEALTQLAVGEALISLLDEHGTPVPADRAKVIPPRSRLGVISNEERQKILQGSPVTGRYERAVDRESAYELLKKRASDDEDQVTSDKSEANKPRETWASTVKSFIKSVAVPFGKELGRVIGRGILGTLTTHSTRRSSTRSRSGSMPLHLSETTTGNDGSVERGDSDS